MWRQAGGVVTQRSPEVSRTTDSSVSEDHSKPTVHAVKVTHGGVSIPRVVSDETLSADDMKGGACGPCCNIQ